MRSNNVLDKLTKTYGAALQIETIYIDSLVMSIYHCINRKLCLLHSNNGYSQVLLFSGFLYFISHKFWGWKNGIFWSDFYIYNCFYSVLRRKRRNFWHSQFVKWFKKKQINEQSIIHVSVHMRSSNHLVQGFVFTLFTSNQHVDA